MLKPFTTIGLIGKLHDTRVARTATQVSRYLGERGLNVVVDEGIAEYLAGEDSEVLSTSMLGERCDLVIVIGGDGTLLYAARALSSYDVPLLGINLGRLGFLVDVSPDEAPATLDQILRGHYQEEGRFLLRAEVWRNGEQVSAGEALNDVVVHNWNVARMMEFKTYVDGQFVNSERADGLIISTPTGSTAYVLAAGGPLLQPTLNALVLAPICPHTLSNRPIVVAGDSLIEVVVCKHTDEAQITFDGQLSFSVTGGDCVRVRKKDRPLRLIHPADHNYFALLRAKLHWGKHP
jgi:NAD+ kinase